MGCAALITLLPLVLVGLAARWFYQMNFTSICGVLAGSMTDPPALAFANAMTASDAPSISYATVYPLTMLLRVLAAQLLVLCCMR
jgi:putative transport protein